MATDTSMLDLAIRGRWSSLVSRAETHPHELGSVDENGMTVFHWACANDPSPRTLGALLRQDELYSSHGHPRAVLMPDNHGITPLMTACVRGNQEHVALLVKSAPMGIPLMDQDGWTALHFVCSSARERGPFVFAALPLLLSRSVAENRAIAFLKDLQYANCPLSLICHSYGFRNGSELINRSTVDDFSLSQVMHTFFGSLQPLGNRIGPWPALCSVLSFAELPLVAATAAILCFEHELHQRNHEGNLPLHIVVSKRWEPGLVKQVVEAYPLAATKRNDRGLLPIQLALITSNRGSNEDIQALLDANPLSLMEAFELDDAIYSPLLAWIKQPNTIYEILRSKPTLVTRGRLYRRSTPTSTD